VITLRNLPGKRQAVDERYKKILTNSLSNEHKDAYFNSSKRGIVREARVSTYEAERVKACNENIQTKA
jgi:hypothetical protein